MKESMNSVSTTKTNRYNPPASKAIEEDKARAQKLLLKILNSQVPYAISTRKLPFTGE